MNIFHHLYSNLSYFTYNLSKNLKIKEKNALILVLAWNFFESIVKNNKTRFKKSKFIKLK